MPGSVLGCRCWGDWDPESFKKMRICSFIHCIQQLFIECLLRAGTALDTGVGGDQHAVSLHGAGEQSACTRKAHEEKVRECHHRGQSEKG